MEALIFLILFGIYICISLWLGAADTAWEKQKKKHKIGLQYFINNDITAANDYFCEAHRHWPNDVCVLVMMGEIAPLENKPEASLMYAQKALRFENSISEPFLLMSRGLHKIDEFEAALQYAKKAVRFGRDLTEPNRWYGLLLIESGNMENGLDYLGKTFAILGQKEQIPFSTHRFLRFKKD